MHTHKHLPVLQRFLCVSQECEGILHSHLIISPFLTAFRSYNLLGLFSFSFDFGSLCIQLQFYSLLCTEYFGLQVGAPTPFWIILIKQVFVPLQNI